jgi:plastocyanin
MAGLFLLASDARAGTGSDCPPIANKPDAIPHVDYNGVVHKTYCYGPVTVQPGQNIIRLNPTNLFPQQPGYITRFDPELVYPNGDVPPVDVLHLHHAVWAVNYSPQFAVGEEKTIVQQPRGFGWRNEPTDSWALNDMLHDLTGEASQVYIVWRIDFVPDSAPAASSIHPVQTRWMDVAGPSIYPVFDALRRMGHDGQYTFPDDAKGAQLDRVGSQATWTATHPVTLIGTAGHLHPGGLKTTMKVQRGDQERKLFTSRAHYFEPAGAVSWDVAQGATTRQWRVKLKAGDTLSVHATYDTKRADWYEVMGIMPVAVYNGTDVGGVDAFSGDIPQKEILTHGHLAENDNHGGAKIGLPNPLDLPNGPSPSGPIDIANYAYSQGDLYSGNKGAKPPTVHPGDSLTYRNLDAQPLPGTFHTLTACKSPCNRSTGIAYPVANGSVTFDSGQLGFNNWAGAPAADRDTWQTPKNLDPGTYSYFCRVHPFMRGSFRVVNG